MTRYATIGTSSIVDLCLEAGAQTSGFEHTVCYSRDRQRGEEFLARQAARVPGSAEEGPGRASRARVETSLEALASADDVDVVYIASPNALHYEQAAQMLAGGKHVLVEKAATATAAEFAELVRLGRDQDRLVVESIRSLFDPSREVIEALLPTLGPIRRVRFSYCQRSRRYDLFRAGQRVNIFDPAMAAGALMDIGTYCVNPLVAWFGSPQSLRASAVLLDNGIDGAGAILAEYPGMLAEVAYSKVTGSDLASEIQGEDATLVIDVIHDPRVLELRRSDGMTEEIVVDKPLPQQAYVLAAMDALIADPARAARFNDTSVVALRLMDQAREQVGVRFPSQG